jgi:hypothetical protein
MKHSYGFSPACLSTLFKVPGGTSMLSFPDTVTVPALVGGPELPVTSPLPRLYPTVRFDSLDQFLDLHSLSFVRIAFTCNSLGAP